jgi:6,7-dimethyl-8-ribityllumazine synthase
MKAHTDSRIAFVQSTWHEAIVDRCRESFAEETAALGLAPGCVDFFKVPGAFELPLHAKRLARTGRYSAVVAAGLVVDGGIYRHEYVAKAVIDGSCGCSWTRTSP